MTKKEREKAIDLLDNLRGMIEDNQGNDYDFALKKGIEALKKESILDKIRAEVKALNPEPTAYDVVDGNPIKDAVWETLSDVLKIIDKYNAESEDKTWQE